MEYIKREIEEEIEKWLDEREVLAIRGPRQCGKTTLLNRIKEILFSRGIKEANIIYIDFEDNLTRIKFEENPKQFISSYFHSNSNSNEKMYFLFDEVQFIKEAGKKLKLIFDSFTNQKIIITGSSSFDLTSLGKHLVGRVIFFDLFPFSFLEFLRVKGERYEKIYKELKIDLKKPELRKTIFLDELNNLFHEYLAFGAYPRVVIENDMNKKKEILKNLFITYVEKDVVSLYGNNYRDKIVILLKSLSGALGGVIKYEEISQNTGLKYKEIKEILSLLQDTFVISQVKPFHKNISSELRKNPKVYFVDYGLRNYLLGNFENLDFSYLYENFVYNQFNKHYKVNYWRTTTKTEVDFIIQDSKNNLIPVEVKSTAKITRALRSFINAYGEQIKIALIPNTNILEENKIDNCKIFFIPFVYL